MEAKRYDWKTLHEYAAALLEQLGLPEADAAAAADSLIRADLEGHESHGISRLPIYAKRLREGRINPQPKPVFERRGSVLKVDGDNGLGQVVAVRALEAALPIAEEQGIAAVFIRGSNHFGTAAFLCQEAVKHGMAAIVTTNSPSGIPPWGGKKAFFGTNPIAFGFPSGNGVPPIIADLSSSVVARGKIIMANKLGQPIPEGWAIDADGNPTTDAGSALQGAVLPLGGAKGYALALAVEVLSGILTQAAYGPHVGSIYKEGEGAANVGHSILLFRLSNWLDPDEYGENIRRFVEEIKAVPRSANSEEILVPGERRHRTASHNRETGIIVPENVRLELEEWGKLYGVPFPNPGVPSVKEEKGTRP